MTAHPNPYGGLIVAAGTLAVFVTMAVVAALPLETQKTLLVEGGVFETLSVVGYGLCIVLLFVLWPLQAVIRRWYFPVLLAVFAGRELDLDKRPFTEGLLKLRQYNGDTVGTTELIISSLLLLGIIVTCLVLLRRETRAFLAGLGRAQPAAFAVLVGVLFIIVYKMIDGLGRKLEPFGITISEDLNNLVSVIEEVGELGIPLMLGIAIYITSHGLTQATGTPSPRRSGAN